MIEKVVVANRGEIACRIIKAAKALGIRTVAIYSDIDRHAKHVKLADEAFYLGPSPVGQSYLNQNRIIDIVKTAQADAIHPGYGFLSENAEFADLCEQNNIIFVGPKSHTIEQLGDKANAKALAKQLQIPIIESIEVPDVLDEQWINHFKQQSGQWMIKACAGGGGKGMRLITADEDFVTTIELAKKKRKPILIMPLLF